MVYSNLEITRFNDLLASKAPAPGGGGASALVASLGTALGSMVCELTSGKRKYAEYQAEIEEILSELSSMRLKLEQLMDEDALAFEPLSKAYAIPKNDPKRDEVMESCLRSAAQPPLEILRLSCQAICLHERLATIGSALAISDVGTGVVFCWAAMYGAAMNVLANTHYMKDREHAGKLNGEVEALMGEHWQKADRVYQSVWERLK